MKKYNNVDLMAMFVFGILVAGLITLDEVLGLVGAGMVVFMYVFSKDFRNKFEIKGAR